MLVGVALLIDEDGLLKNRVSIWFKVEWRIGKSCKEEWEG